MLGLAVGEKEQGAVGGGRGMREWRMKEMCRDCPFQASGAGKRLADSLRPGRMASILRGLLRGENFECHKTTDETGDGTKLLCAGAIAFQEKMGVSSQYVRICQRLDGRYKSKKVAI